MSVCLSILPSFFFCIGSHTHTLSLSFSLSLSLSLSHTHTCTLFTCVYIYIYIISYFITTLHQVHLPLTDVFTNVCAMERKLLFSFLVRFRVNLLHTQKSSDKNSGSKDFQVRNMKNCLISFFVCFFTTSLFIYTIRFCSRSFEHLLASLLIIISLRSFVLLSLKILIKYKSTIITPNVSTLNENKLSKKNKLSTVSLSFLSITSELISLPWEFHQLNTFLPKVIDRYIDR